jgi:hypothetical protein
MAWRHHCIALTSGALLPAAETTKLSAGRLVIGGIGPCRDTGLALAAPAQARNPSGTSAICAVVQPSSFVV